MGEDPKAIENDHHHLETLLPIVYGQLHALARSFLRGERPGHTLQPTALINEVYLRLSRERKDLWRDPSHFLAIAAQAMRRVLVDSARIRRAAKRGSGMPRIPLEEAVAATTGGRSDLVDLDEALTRLAEIHPDHARLVELRFFAGLSSEEAARVLGISPSGAERGWRAARTWLFRRLTAADGERRSR